MTATVRLGPGQPPSTPQIAAAIVAQTVLTAQQHAPLTQKHCPRSGSRHALPACAVHLSFLYHRLEAGGSFTPPMVVARAVRPSDDASLAQCCANPPLRPPRRLV